jgi:hypothetical protein
LTYTLPRRLGKFSIGITNAMNTEFQTVDFSDNLLTIPSESLVFARLSASF